MDAGRWIDSGTGPGWSPEHDPSDVPDNAEQTTEQTTEQTLGTAWEMHDDPELDLPEVPDRPAGRRADSDSASLSP
jgi:hypothetical protein